VRFASKNLEMTCPEGGLKRGHIFCDHAQSPTVFRDDMRHGAGEEFSLYKVEYSICVLSYLSPLQELSPVKIINKPIPFNIEMESNHISLSGLSEYIFGNDRSAQFGN
jgi:hypothetical protein